MRFTSAWASHKAKKCLKECYYCDSIKNRGVSVKRWIKGGPLASKQKSMLTNFLDNLKR